MDERFASPKGNPWQTAAVFAGIVAVIVVIGYIAQKWRKPWKPEATIDVSKLDPLKGIDPALIKKKVVDPVMLARRPVDKMGTVLQLAKEKSATDLDAALSMCDKAATYASGYDGDIHYQKAVCIAEYVWFQKIEPCPHKGVVGKPEEFIRYMDMKINEYELALEAYKQPGAKTRHTLGGGLEGKISRAEYALIKTRELREKYSTE